jgi:hypothetical protein
MYRAAKRHIRENKGEILFKRWGVSNEQIENARETKNNLLTRLNAGEEVDLNKELGEFFK